MVTGLVFVFEKIARKKTECNMFWEGASNMYIWQPLI